MSPPSFHQVLILNDACCSQCTKRGHRICSASCVHHCHTDYKEALTTAIHDAGVKRFEFFEAKDKSIDWTSLQGDETMQVLKNLDLGVVFVGLRLEQIEKLWSDYLDINNSLHNSVDVLLQRTVPPSAPLPQRERRGGGPPIPLNEMKE